MNNSPQTKIKVVGITVKEEIKKLSSLHSNLIVYERPFYIEDLDECDVVITAVNSRTVSETIFNKAKEKRKLINSADLPELCDFYLGSIVQKGNLKIAISTNGKSPTVAKRLKEIFAAALPAQVDDVLNNLSIIRGKLNGSFHEKIKKLNEITQVLAVDEPTIRTSNERWWRRIATYSLFAFFFAAACSRSFLASA